MTQAQQQGEQKQRSKGLLKGLLGGRKVSSVVFAFVAVVAVSIGVALIAGIEGGQKARIKGFTSSVPMQDAGTGKPTAAEVQEKSPSELPSVVEALKKEERYGGRLLTPPPSEPSGSAAPSRSPSSSSGFSLPVGDDRPELRPGGGAVRPAVLKERYILEVLAQANRQRRSTEVVVLEPAKDVPVQSGQVQSPSSGQEREEVQEFPLPAGVMWYRPYAARVEQGVEARPGQSIKVSFRITEGPLKGWLAVGTASASPTRERFDVELYALLPPNAGPGQKSVPIKGYVLDYTQQLGVVTAVRRDELVGTVARSLLSAASVFMDALKEDTQVVIYQGGQTTVATQKAEDRVEEALKAGASQAFAETAQAVRERAPRGPMLILEKGTVCYVVLEPESTA
ncbi:MAG: hypothetical protein QW650_01025 [Thermofilum sp.]